MLIKQKALTELEAESENIRSAANWAAIRQKIERLSQLTDGLGQFYEMRSQFQEGDTVFELIGQNLTGARSSQAIRIMIRVFTWRSSFLRRMGLPDQAYHCLQQGLTLLTDVAVADDDFRREKAFILQEEGQLLQQSDIEACQERYQQSLKLYQALGDQWETANVLYLIALLIGYRENDHARARQSFEHCLMIRRTLGDQRGIVDALVGAGFEAVLDGARAEGEKLLQESLSMRQETGYQAFNIDAVTLSTLCSGFIFLGRYSEVQALLADDFAFIDDLGSPLDLRFKRASQGLANLHLGRYQEARAQLQTSLSMARELGHRWGVAHSLRCLGQMMLTEENYAQAQQVLQESADRYREVGNQAYKFTVLPLLSYATLRLNDLPKTRLILTEVLTAFSTTWSPVQFAGALPFVALYWVEHRDVTTGIELYALANTYPHVASSRWYEDAVGRYIAAAAETLPPEVIEAAKIRGKLEDIKAITTDLLLSLQKR